MAHILAGRRIVSHDVWRLACSAPRFVSLQSQLNFRRSFSVDSNVQMHNSLSGQLETFVDLKEPPRPIRWYNCGPTVYDSAHLGHARTYVCLDIIRRTLKEYFQLDVLYALGLTDVDDKIIERAASTGTSPISIARKFEAEFFEDLQLLGVEPPDVVLRVAEHIPDIVEYIIELEAKGFAYLNEVDNSIYFNVGAFNQANHSYGKMAPHAAVTGNVEKNANEGDSNALAGHLKRDPRDFVLWKAAKPDIEPQSVQWQSPWGLGRPGWHIECSVMSRVACGDYLDLHSGGVDLKFPHHCNEIAQSEAFNSLTPSQSSNGCCGGNHVINDAEWSRFFLHTGHLFIKGLKMSKSLKNFISVRDLLKTPKNKNSHPVYTADTFRMFCLQYSYRSSVYYSTDRMDEANALLHKFSSFIDISGARLAASRAIIAKVTSDYQQSSDLIPNDMAMTAMKRWTDDERCLRKALSKCREGVHLALTNDFDTPKVLSELQILIQVSYDYMQRKQKVELGNSSFMPVELLDSVCRYLVQTLQVFGFKSFHATDVKQAAIGIPHDTNNDQLNVLLEFRAALRGMALSAEKNNSLRNDVLAVCDSLRDLVLPKVVPSHLIADLSSTQTTLEDAWQLRTQQLHKIQLDQSSSSCSKKSEDARRSNTLEHQRLMQIPLNDLQMFFEAVQPGEFSKFDEHGFPLLDKNGQLLSKSRKKKLRKRLAKHEATYAKFHSDNYSK